MQQTLQPLNYLAMQEDAVLSYHASDMVLAVGGPAHLFPPFFFLARLFFPFFSKNCRNTSLGSFYYSGVYTPFFILVCVTFKLELLHVTISAVIST